MSAPFSEEFPSVAQVSPQTIAAAADAVSTYVDFSDGGTICGTAIAGAISALSVVTVSFLQATAADGTDAKALTAGGFAAKTFSASADDTILEFRGGTKELLDTENAFTHVAMKIAVVGGTDAIMCGVIRRGPAAYRD